MKRLSEAPTIHDGARVVDSTLGRWTEIGEGSHLHEVEMGDYSYCARLADLAYTRIGKFSNIASMVRIGPGNHPTWRASLHHFQYRSAAYWPGEAEDDAAFFDWRRSQSCEIGHDTWLGYQAIVLAGVTVHTGAVVGAGAVVTRDVGPYEIAVGNPARTVKRRFSPEIAERLTALCWWDWDHARILGALEDFRTLSVEAFLEKHGG